MPGFSPELLADIANTTLDAYLKRRQVTKQNIQNKPMFKAFDEAAGKFPGGKELVSKGVAAGQGGGSLQGYTGDDPTSFYNPTGTKRAAYPWKEMHIGMGLTHTELKVDGLDINEEDGGQEISEVSDRDMQVLANRLDEKNEALMEDYDRGMDILIHGDGTSDVKAIAGVRSVILDVPNTGVTGTLSRSANPWWRNRAATVAFGLAGGQGAITVNPANGGALAAFLKKEFRQLKRYAGSKSKWQWFAGSDWLDGYSLESRANGNYTMTGWQNKGQVDLGAADETFKGQTIEYDPMLDELGLSKRCYILDISSNGLELMYYNGVKMKRHKPARPYDRYVMYKSITTTALLAAWRLNTSAVYDIA